MKRSDIDDVHVIALSAARWGTDGTNTNGDPTAPSVVAALIDEGVPEKLARAKVLHLTDRGLLDYGVSTTWAWPTDKGLALLWLRVFADMAEADRRVYERERALVERALSLQAEHAQAWEQVFRLAQLAAES